MDKIDLIYIYAQLPENQFDKDVLNQEFKKLLENIDENDQDQLEYNFLLKYCLFIADNLHENIDHNLQKLTENILKKVSSQTIFRVFFTLKGLFLQESYLGPSFSYNSIEKRLKQEKQEKSQLKKRKKFPFYNFQTLLEKLDIQVPEEHLEVLDQNIKNLNFYNYKFVKSNSLIFRKEKTYQEHLEVDGEQWGRLVPYTNLFIVFRCLINYLQKQRGCESIFFSLWAARVAYFHNNILFTPTGTIKEIVNELYNKFFDEVFKTNKQKYESLISKQQKVLFHCEISNVMLFFYQYNASKQHLTEAQSSLGINFNFTGKMGIRTKFQTFKVAQLVVEVENQEEQKELEKENSQVLNPYEFLSDQAEVKKEKFDEECILYETPQLDQEEQKTEEKNTKSELNIYEQILLIGIMRNLEISTAHDEIYQEQVMAYCNLLVDKSLNWLVFTNSLFIRSINEFEKYKRMERALLQLQTLLDQFNDKEPKFLQRSLYIYPLIFPSQLELNKIVAQKYMKVGMMRTACDIFEQLEMFEDCVECLAMSGQVARAKEIAKEYIEKYPNSPKMLCILGDLFGDAQYYKKAWKTSNKRFARAQRSLGRVYFFENKIEKAIKAFQKAVAINSLVIEPWFTMGCAYMKINQPLKAIRSFSQVITINNTQGDAWANMANAYLNLGKKEEAFSTLEQAVKHNESSWKMWSNLMQVSFMTKKFYKFFECIQRIINLGKGLEIIDKTILKNLNQVFAYQIQLMKKATHKSPFQTMKRRIERLYILMGEKIGQQPAVWEYFADFTDLCVAYSDVELFLDKQVERNKQIESEAYSGGGKVRFASDTKTYKTEKELVDEYSINVQKLRQRVYDLRLSACNVLMVSGWEDSRQICELLVPLAEQLIESHIDAERGEEGDIEIKRFLKTITPQIEKNLEKKVQFNFEY